MGETFRTLFEMWGVVIPLREYPEIDMGGHVVGGAFGFLCRQLGLAADQGAVGPAGCVPPCVVHSGRIPI